MLIVEYRKIVIWSIIIFILFQQINVSIFNNTAIAKTNEQIELILDGEATYEKTSLRLINHSDELFESIQLTVPAGVTINDESLKEKYQDFQIRFEEQTNQLVILNENQAIAHEFIFDLLNLTNSKYEVFTTVKYLDGEQFSTSLSFSLNTLEEINPTTKEPQAKAVAQKNLQQTNSDNQVTTNSTAEIYKTLPTNVGDVASELKQPNIELYLTPSNYYVMSGKVENFELNFKVTGSELTYADVELVVNLPTNDSIPVQYPQIKNGIADDSLIIGGVKPIYDGVNRTLVYQFATLETGQSYRVPIKVLPPLGTTPYSDMTTDHLKLISSASMKIGENGTPVSTGTQTMSVVSVGAINVVKSIDRVYKAENGVYVQSNDPADKGDLIEWVVKVTIPNNSYANSFIDTQKKIKVVDQLPQWANYYDYYQPDQFKGKYDQSTHLVSWEFDAPTIDEQKVISTSGNLFEKEVKIYLVIDGNTPNYTTLKNNAKASYYPLGSSNALIDTAESHVYIGNELNSIDNPNGVYIHGTHEGPLDSVGNSQWPTNDFTRPNVTDKAFLQFAIHPHVSIHKQAFRVKSPTGAWSNWDTTGGYNQATTGHSSFERHIVNTGYEYFNVEYNIDSKLDLKYIELRKPVAYYISTIPQAELDVLPDIFIQLKINGVWQQEYPYTGGFPQWNSIYHSYSELLDVTRLGKKPGDHVEAFNVIYRNASGKMATAVHSLYDVYEGATGVARNYVMTSFKLKDGTLVEHNSSGIVQVPEGVREVNIVDEVTVLPTVKTSIDFVDESNYPIPNTTEVERGSNKIKVEFINMYGSENVVEGPIELVTLLPKGVKMLVSEGVEYFATNNTYLPNFESVNPRYEILGEIDGQQRIKIIWDNEKLLPNQSLSAVFHVDVERTALSNLNLSVYGYSKSDNLKVLDNSGGDISENNTLEQDAKDLNVNNVLNEQTIKGSNLYKIASHNNLQIKKFIKGSLDSAYSYLGSTVPNGDVSYKFELTNTTGEIIEKFYFIDVLPSVGDLGITDNVLRDSKFEVALKGPISFIDTKWDGKVDVFYSTAKNPSRHELNVTVNYPIGATAMPDPIGAEQPTWLTGGEVTDWSSIHSFKIVMKPGVEWLEGQDISIVVNAIAPNFSYDDPILDTSLPMEDRVAWNSFAATANGLLPVEPLKVGVVIQPNLGSLEITKVDQETQNVLQGATFELWKTCKNIEGISEKCGEQPVQLGTTEIDGKIVFKNIPNGNYQLIETNAPSGYSLLTAPIDVVVNSTESIKLIVENSRSGWELPNSGGRGSTIYWVIGLLFMLMAFRKLQKIKSYEKY